MKFSILFLVSFISFSLFGQNTNKPEDIHRHLSKLVNEKITVGIATGVASPDFSWTTCAGHADSDLESPFLSVTPVRTASIAKPMTAISIMQLVEKGKIDLDEYVRTYLPEYDIAKLKNIKVKHILQHSSGLRGYKNSKENNNKKNFTSMAEAANIVLGDDLLFNPGSDFMYTSYGYNTAGLLIERISGMSYDAYLQKNIFEPAGMVNSSIARVGQLPKDVSSVYHQKKPGKIKLITDHNISDRIPGGGVLSTVEDLLNFGQAVLENKLISKESLDLMITDTGLKKEGNGYGMGWYLYGENPKYGNVIGHSGGQLGCSSFIFLFPEDKVVTVALSNTSGMEVAPIAMAIRDLPENEKN